MAETLVLGGASWNTMVYLERFPEPVPATIANARSNIAAGSTGIGKALAAHALGHDVLLHATIGDDEPGRHIRDFCSRRGIAAHFDIDPGGTSRHVNLMDAEGRRISIFLFNGSPRPPVDVAAMADPIAAASTIFLNITQSSAPLLPLVRASKADVWVDLHDYDGSNPWHGQFIAEADVIQLSDENLPDPRAVMERLAETARLVVCTRGRNGALARARGEWQEQRAHPARLADSNGAGDTFMVGVWHALREGRSLAAALDFAAAAAAVTIESLDLVPETLTADAAEARRRT